MKALCQNINKPKPMILILVGEKGFQLTDVARIVSFQLHSANTFC